MAISRQRTLSALVGLAATAALVAGCSSDSGDDDGDELRVSIKNAAGVEVATAEFEFDDGYVTVEVETVGTGKLEPGFHGLHIHSVGKCEANSASPSDGKIGDFNSAGGHFQAPGHEHHPASGDLTSLQVRQDGGALLVTTTDQVTREQLTAGAGTAIIIHAGPDNFANIPAERYTQADGTPGPDASTMATGDAGARVACGVISAGDGA